MVSENHCGQALPARDSVGTGLDTCCQGMQQEYERYRLKEQCSNMSLIDSCTLRHGFDCGILLSNCSDAGRNIVRRRFTGLFAIENVLRVFACSFSIRMFIMCRHAAPGHVASMVALLPAAIVMHIMTAAHDMSAHFCCQ
jgi:hypothetical protein